MQLLFLTGVSGSGKSTIGKLLAGQSGVAFYDGDDLHPPENVEKMRSGRALTDEDRELWLEAIRRKAQEAAVGSGGIFACSALKAKYRRYLESGLEGKICWILLDGNYAQIALRLSTRQGHYMPPSLLQSQFDILEKDAQTKIVSIAQSPEAIAAIIRQHWQLYPDMKQEFGLIGLGVMGKSLSRNFASKGIQLALYNRHISGLEEHVARDFIAAYPELSGARGFDDLPAFVNSLAQPRKIMLMVNAGKPTDDVIEALTPLLAAGDVLIDGGNTHYRDTERRMAELAVKGIHFLGAGVSGGEEGALRGPAIMPGGPAEAYALVRDALERIAAPDRWGGRCCAYTGGGASGHFVKMVHNGIEYAEMQLIAEVYYILRCGLGQSPEAIASLLETWNASDAGSYLLEISVSILRRKEEGVLLLDQILDAASNKGTGAWATIAAAELGVAATLIGEALFSRYISAFWAVRQEAAQAINPRKETPFTGLSTDQLLEAYQLARVVNHHQGIALMRAASDAYGWQLDLPEIARIWTNGCIIRSGYMVRLIDLLQKGHQTLLAPEQVKQIQASVPSLKQSVCMALAAGLETPCLTAALNYLLAFSNAASPMNLIQAQRDFFGAHRIQWKTDPNGPSAHINWLNHH